MCRPDIRRDASMLEPLMTASHHVRQRAFTLIELMVVVVIGAVLLTMVGPSFLQMIRVQRLNSINSQLITDLQFARSEAASRGVNVWIAFQSNASASCYTLFTATASEPSVLCNCLAATACTAPGLTEIRTSRVTADTAVAVTPASGMPTFIAFDPITGGLWQSSNDSEIETVPSFIIDAVINTTLALKTMINLGGRPTVCAPTGSTMRAAPCR